MVGFLRDNIGKKLIYAIIMLNAACTPLSEYSGDERQPDSSVIALPERDSVAAVYTKAADDLLIMAGEQLVAKDYQRAAVAAERAIRIAPEDGRAYLALAKARYYQRLYAQSSSLLSRAKRLASRDELLMRDIAKWEDGIETPPE